MKKILLCILALALSLACAPAIAQSTEQPESYTLTFGVEYRENLLLNTYDLTCYLDDVELLTMSQGDKQVFSVQVAAGKHTFSVVGMNKAKSSDKIELDVSADICFSVRCKAKWTGLKIEQFNVAADESAIVMKKDASFLGRLEELVNSLITGK